MKRTTAKARNALSRSMLLSSKGGNTRGGLADSRALADGHMIFMPGETAIPFRFRIKSGWFAKAGWNARWLRGEYHGMKGLYVWGVKD